MASATSAAAQSGTWPTISALAGFGTAKRAPATDSRYTPSISTCCLNSAASERSSLAITVAAHRFLLEGFRRTVAGHAVAIKFRCASTWPDKTAPGIYKPPVSQEAERLIFTFAEYISSDFFTDARKHVGRKTIKPFFTMKNGFVPMGLLRISTRRPCREWSLL